MASSPVHEPPLFRVPPPSPIAGHGRSYRSDDDSDDDELTHFLDHSFHLPELILPDRIFPSEIPVAEPPKMDVRSFTSPHENDDSSVTKALEAAAGFGCFQLVNHGISDHLIRSVTNAASGIFRIPAEKKATVQRSPERRYGFETIFVDEEEEDEEEASEEFYWCRLREEEEALEKVMEVIWPHQFWMFRYKLVVF